MRAQEFVAEAKRGKIPGGHDSAMVGAHIARDPGGYDRANWLNRVMMATACHDGRSKDAVPSDRMDPASWVEKYNTLHAYTEEEHNMIHGAMKTIGAEKHEVVSNTPSTEKSDTHRTSPVKGFRGFR